MWTFRLPHPRRRPACAAAQQPQAGQADEADAERPAGCGWFDSSHELRHGLCVHELQEPAQLARELPLPAWIDLQLSACQATHSAARS